MLSSRADFSALDMEDIGRLLSAFLCFLVVHRGRTSGFVLLLKKRETRIFRLEMKSSKIINQVQ